MKTMEKGTDRVRENTSEEINQEIDRRIKYSVQAYSGQSREAISRRMEELNREWDVERTLETTASAIALTGVTLGATVNKKWLIMPGVVLSFLLQQALQGWCPPLPIIRRMGIRTRQEIESERYALKALRGDFEKAKNAHAALEAAHV
jgi:hypothetical protein